MKGQHARILRKQLGGVVLCVAVMLGMSGSQYEASSEPPGMRPITGASESDSPAVFEHPTYSSPIALSADNNLVWVVNPNDDSVSVIRTDLNTVIKKIAVGDQPQSIALDPSNHFAYVANAAGSSVTVIRIASAAPDDFHAEIDRRHGHRGELKTGAEPWDTSWLPPTADASSWPTAARTPSR